MAKVYMNILKYRKLRTATERRELFPVIYGLHHVKYLGVLWVGIGVAAFLVNEFICTSANGDPRATPQLVNALYWGLSRHVFVLGSFTLMLAILTGQFNFGKAIFGLGAFRVLAKAIPMACVFELLAIELLYTSDRHPEGIFVNFARCLLYGLGFMVITFLFSYLFLVLIEFPI